MMYKIYLKKRACLRFFINYLFVIFLYYVVVLFYLFYISLRCFMEVFVFLIERTRCRSHRVRASTGSCLRRSTSWLNTDPLVTSLVTGRSHTLYYFEILYSIDPLFCDIVLYRYTVIYWHAVLCRYTVIYWYIVLYRYAVLYRQPCTIWWKILYYIDRQPVLFGDWTISSCCVLYRLYYSEILYYIYTLYYLEILYYVLLELWKLVYNLISDMDFTDIPWIK